MRATGAGGAPRDLVPGDRFAGRYRVIDLLGRGGMGAVYRVTDELLGESVALKLASLRGAGDDVTFDDLFDAMRREVSLARRVTHPNVARVFDMGVHEGTLFLTMELVDGATLRQRLRRAGVLSLDAAISTGRQVASALACAHEAGVLHLDLKPSNVMLDEREPLHVTLIDFGVARALGSSGSCAGTIDYMAPEQLDSGHLGGGADVYALGLVLHEALTGAYPFDGDDPAQRMLARLHEAPRPLPAHAPRELHTLVAAMLAPGPGERPFAAEVATTLARLHEAIEPPSRRVSSAPPTAATLTRLPAHLGLRLAEARRRLCVNGNERHALAACDAALAQCPDLDVALALRALALVRLSTVTQADPWHPEVVGTSAQAVAEAIARAPHLADTHVADALIAEASGNLAYAVRALSRALTREPLHAYAHEMLGRHELECGVDGDERVRLAHALAPTHVVGLVSVAREMFFVDRDTEAFALLDSLDRTHPGLYEVLSLRARAALWRRDEHAARFLLDRLPSSTLPFFRMLHAALDAFLGAAPLTEANAAFEHVMHRTLTPRRRSFLHQLWAELLGTLGDQAALHHLARAAELPLTDLRWLDACPPLAPFRAHPTFRETRALVVKRIVAAFPPAG